MTSAFHATVHGLVQGVAFRHYTRVTASGLGLAGWVRNLPDGSVELIAEGEREALDRLAAWIAQGPDRARVERVELEWIPPTGLSGRFQIRY